MPGRPGSRSAGYDALKERARARSAGLSATGRDIGEIPPVAHPRRRARCKFNLRLYCETYHPETFPLKWSEDHLKAIAKIERCALRGGLYAWGMPRGSGKSSLCEVGGEWAVMYGHRGFLVMIGQESGAAHDMLDSMKIELETNDRLLEDFPEVIYPIHCLDRISQRAKGQMHHGKHTYIDWTDEQVVMPTIPGSAASGAIIRVAGITGRILGMKHKNPGGKVSRPDFVVVDDPQTDESAHSVTQTGTRLKILQGAVLKLAGPGKSIAGYMPCMCIAKDDLVDQVLNRDRFPQWQGDRMRMLYAMPSNDRLWGEYEMLRMEELKAERGIAAATEFYRAHMAKCGLPMNKARPCGECEHKADCMDCVAIVAWPERFKEEEASGLQHAMNLKFEDPLSFAAQCQQEPEQAEALKAMLTADQIAAKVNGHERRLSPLHAEHLTAYIDVQGAMLFYVVAAWTEEFGGYVIDYGTWPDQHRPRFSLNDASRTLAMAFPRAALTGRIFGGLEALAGQILGAEWPRDDGAMMQIERCLVDANWGESTDVVYQFCRQSAYAARLLPAHGVYIGASSQPWSEYKKKAGERLGHHWRVPSVQGKRAVRHALYDTNYWKSFVHERFTIPMGDPGCLSLWGRRAEAHRLFAEHLTAEYSVPTTARGRTVDEWKIKRAGMDNHWFDCLVGCAVAASMQGARARGHDAGAVQRKVVSFAEQQRMARARR